MFRDGGESLAWPGGEVALLGLLAGWLLLSRVLVRALPRIAGLRPTAPAAHAAVAGEGS